MLQRMDIKIFMAFEHNQIMSVSLVIAKEEVLAVSRIYILPIFKSKFDCRKRRMNMKFILKAMILKKFENRSYFLIDIFHYLRLFA